MDDITVDLIRQVSRLQAQVDGLVRPELGRWINWTPTVSQSAAITITINFAYYNVVNGVVFAGAYLTMNSAGTAANAIVLGGLPTPAAPFSTGVVLGGSWWFSDTGSGVFYAGVVNIINSTQFHFYTGGGLGGPFGVTPAITIASTDWLTINLVYRKA